MVHATPLVRLPARHQARPADRRRSPDGEVLRPEDLHRADELAVVNSLRGWQGATLWTGAASSDAEQPSVSLEPGARI